MACHFLTAVFFFYSFSWVHVLSDNLLHTELHTFTPGRCQEQPVFYYWALHSSSGRVLGWSVMFRLISTVAAGVGACLIHCPTFYRNVLAFPHIQTYRVCVSVLRVRDQSTLHKKYVNRSEMCKCNIVEPLDWCWISVQPAYYQH